MKRHADTKKGAATGPSQRQLRAGELIRHALVEILREEELQDEALHNISVAKAETAAKKTAAKAETATGRACGAGWAAAST